MSTFLFLDGAIAIPKCLARFLQEPILRAADRGSAYSAARAQELKRAEAQS
ncbi:MULTISPECIES: hypothetical protein [Micrococcaceae]|uniref:hypothetical protein n=1 Tax=unclassified Kocuria TaxID=2649579 RepID=UPI0013E9B43F|nr:MULTISPECIES: hypothetical protein [unclassified Kocuria]